MSRTAIWFTFIVVAVALLLGWLAHAEATERLVYVENPFAAALQALGALLIVATFVERAVEVFVASAWEEERESVRAQLKAARTAGDAGLTQVLSDRVIALRGEVRAATRLVTIVLGALVALGGVSLLNSIVTAPPDNDWLQAIAFRASDIAITAGLIGGGSKVIHQVMEVITQNVAKFRQTAPDDQLAGEGMATAAAISGTAPPMPPPPAAGTGGAPPPNAP